MIIQSRREYLLTPLTQHFYMALVFVGLAGAYAVVGYRIYFEGNSLNWLYLLMLIQVTPILYCFGRQSYHYLSFILMNHFICFSIPKYNKLVLIERLDQLYPEAQMALQELIFCTILLSGMYFFARLLFFQTHVERQKFQTLSLSRWQLIIVSAYVVSLPMVVKELPPFLMAIHFTLVAADLILLMSSDSPGNENLARYLRLGVYLSSLLYFVQTGALMMVGNVASFMFVTACLRRKYSMLIVPAILTVMASSLQVVKSNFRGVIQANRDMGVVQRTEVLSDLVQEQFFPGEMMEDGSNREDEKEDVDLLMNGFQRLGDDSLERVLSLTPRTVPYWDGESYYSIPFMFIPRLLWPDKPTRHFWNKFGRSYGYLSEDDYATSVAVNYFAEGYMNFGFFGMYFVAIFLGAFIAFVERLSYVFFQGPFYFTYLVFLIPLMSYQIDLTSIMQSVIFIVAVIVLFRKQMAAMALKDEYS